MSKHMQLTVKVHPYYKNGMKGIYPCFADVLSHIDKSEADPSLSLFDLVGNLDKLLYRLEGNPSFRKILLGHRESLQKLYVEAQALIADWKLSEVDRLLYQMEDIFDEIEWELGGL